MNTPVNDFLEHYAGKDVTRLHMPGHKGKGESGLERFDITEIAGADVLYHESGILAESQANAAALFGTKATLYSTEGSTLAIRAMLTLAVKAAAEKGQKPVIAAGRNAHKAFLTACALLDLSPIWLSPKEGASLLSCPLTAREIETFLESATPAPTAVYLTSPDYLGNVCDIAAISKVCRARGVLLLVDNAHGAYLQFLPESQHPVALGADLVCDSAHKTLPVLTGGAYLHVGKGAPENLALWAKDAMRLFSSTSPSYLILRSLDRCNALLAGPFREALIPFTEKVAALKKELKRLGFPIVGDEPLKITVMPKAAGYTGDELASILRKARMEPEFSDPDHVVLMLSPLGGDEALEMLHLFFSVLPQREPVLSFPPPPEAGEAALSPRQAMLAPSEVVPVEQAVGRVLAEPGVTCPPAVPIAVCGERLEEKSLRIFRYYGIETVTVVKE